MGISISELALVAAFLGSAASGLVGLRSLALVLFAAFAVLLVRMVVTASGRH